MPVDFAGLRRMMPPRATSMATPARGSARGNRRQGNTMPTVAPGGGGQNQSNIPGGFNFGGDYSNPAPSVNTPELSSLYGNGGFKIKPILSYLDAAFNAAKQGNETRYNQGLQLLQGGYSQALGLLDTMGTTGKQDIMDAEKGQLADADQSNLSRGLYNTTVVNSDRSRVNYNTTRSLNDLAERVNTAKSGLIERGAQGIAGFIADRQDEYPDQGMWLGLIDSISKEKAAKDEREQQIANEQGYASANGIPLTTGPAVRSGRMNAQTGRSLNAFQQVMGRRRF